MFSRYLKSKRGKGGTNQKNILKTIGLKNLKIVYLVLILKYENIFVYIYLTSSYLNCVTDLDEIWYLFGLRPQMRRRIVFIPENRIGRGGCGQNLVIKI